MVELQEGNSTKSTDDKIHNFAKDVVQDICNQGKMSANTSQLRYLLSEVKIAINTFLESRKLYKVLKEQDLYSYSLSMHRLQQLNLHLLKF